MTQKLSYWLWRTVLAFSTFFALFKFAAIMGFGLRGVAIWTTWVYMLLGILVAGFAYTRLRKIRRREVESANYAPALTEPVNDFTNFNESKERVEIWK